MNSEIQVLGADVTDLMQPQRGGLLEAGADNILYMAERAEQYIAAMNKIMKAALKITTEKDWCLIGGQPYLQETGATKVARLFGISIQIVGEPAEDMDPKGYKTYTYRARFMLRDQFVEAEGSRSMKDEFFSGKGCTKGPDEIDERDVKLAAYTNCVNNGIKKLIPGLRGLSVADLEAAGFNPAELKGYTFKTGSRGGNSGKAEDSGLQCSVCGVSITQAEASYSESKFGDRLCRACQKARSQG